MSAVATPATSPSSTPPPAANGRRLWKWTREDYYNLGELGFFDGKRVELIYGEIVEKSPIHIAHANGVGLAASALTRTFASGYHVRVQQPFWVPGMTPGSEPQPDVSVIPRDWRDYTDHPTTAVLLVEVADTTFFDDSTTKAELYATAGVADYWVLDLNNRQLHVFRDPQPLTAGLGATAYKTRLTFGHSDAVTPVVAPGAIVRVNDLLP